MKQLTRKQNEPKLKINNKKIESKVSNKSFDSLELSSSSNDENDKIRKFKQENVKENKEKPALPKQVGSQVNDLKDSEKTKGEEAKVEEEHVKPKKSILSESSDSLPSLDWEESKFLSFIFR